MAKPVIKFSAVAYAIGDNTGYRPLLEGQDSVADLDFCKEVVTEKRLAMSPEELLHAVEMLGEVGPAKVAADGRPRIITKLLKYNRFAKGNLESPTSAWNDSCKAYVRPQLMNDVEKTIDASFVNVNSGIGVKLNYVAWVGAKTVTNVIKVGKPFGAYGNHMEFDAALGDTAKITVGTTSYPLTCTDSDVAHALFAWPDGLNPEAGTQVVFEMNSRGGVEGGETYLSKKTVTVIAGEPVPSVTAVQGEGLEAGQVRVNVATHVTGANLANITSAKIAFTNPEGAAETLTITPTENTDSGFDFTFLGGPAAEYVNNPKLVVTNALGTAEFAVEYL